MHWNLICKIKSILVKQILCIPAWLDVMDLSQKPKQQVHRFVWALWMIIFIKIHFSPFRKIDPYLSEMENEWYRPPNEKSLQLLVSKSQMDLLLKEKILEI